MTLSNFLVLDLDLDNILRNFFFSITICHSDHKTNIITEFTLNHGSRWYITNTMHIWQYCHIWLLQSDNGHHCWIHTKKWFQMIYNTFDIVFRLSWILALTLYLGGLPYLGSWSWHCSHIHMVTWIMKLTSPFNSCWKMVLEDVWHLCVCWTCHIWSLWSRNRHHHWIHIKKWFLKMYHTCVFAGLTIYGHSDHKTDITVEFTSKNGS